MGNFSKKVCAYGIRPYRYNFLTVNSISLNSRLSTIGTDVTGAREKFSSVTERHSEQPSTMDGDPHLDAVVNGFRLVELPRIQVRSRVRTEGAMHDFACELDKCFERLEQRHQTTNLDFEPTHTTETDTKSPASEASSVEHCDPTSTAHDALPQPPKYGSSHESLQELSNALMRSLEQQKQPSIAPHARVPVALAMHAPQVRQAPWSAVPRLYLCSHCCC